mgnify:CR=1 FL=1
MAIRKKKVSELPEEQSFIGLWTLGVNALNKSVKVSLEFIKRAYDNVVAATKKALDAAAAADKSREQIEANESTRQSNENTRVSSEKKRVDAEKKRVTEEENRVTEFGTIKIEAVTATGNAKAQADRAKDLADHPTQMGENGNWWKWDLVQKKYIDTGILAKGGVLYPSFDILDDDMCLYMTYEDDIAADQFELDANGCLNFKFK